MGSKYLTAHKHRNRCILQVNRKFRRLKQTGSIRKISGAYVSQLILFINKKLFRWNLVAFVIACPLVYIIMHNRLQNFAYKTGISWWVFIVAGVATFIITLLTVSWQRYKAALQKPTEAIRQE
ncbi:MAG: hypothetical protein ABIN67_17250 [Ferruginibacter sp.]